MNAADIQRALRAAGFGYLDVDGIIGPKTKVMVSAFQLAHALDVDGVPGPDTQAALQVYLQAPTSATADMQRALLAAGFNPGQIDGAWGPNTRSAVRAFQRAHGLFVDGQVGPDTLGALFTKGKAPSNVAPPWYEEAMRKMGLREIQDNAALKAFLASDGHALGDPAKLPWCGDMVETCILRTLPNETVPLNPYWAQNWAKFGRKLAVPAVGAILVYQRPGGGHVGFYAGESGTSYYTLGGNQANTVSITPIDKKRCIAIRWPSTVPLPTTGRVMMSGGTISSNEA
jgi:uncharacterized protein (TIGR02594 family)